MIIIIPTGWTYTSTVNGQVPKGVCCAHCRHEFVYIAHFASVGSSSVGLLGDQQAAQAQAAASARAFVEHAARKATNWVPCPNCGWVQKDMYQDYRRKVATWGIVVGGVCSLLTLPILANVMRDVRDVSGWIPPLIMALPLTLGTLFAGLWYVLYNPNAFEETRRGRINEGRKRTFGREEFEKQQAEAERAEYDRAMAERQSFPQTLLAPIGKAGNAQEANSATIPAAASQTSVPPPRDTRTPDQKRADAKARRDAEMARIAGQARQNPPA
ncbi:MAG: hypothetical protein IT461_03390 [Planctomycetes bacterium]|jgi:hypothetical protein|nr:hypothetical protein [Planctomycetota bacterium]